MTLAQPIITGAPYDELRARTTGTVVARGERRLRRTGLAVEPRHRGPARRRGRRAHSAGRRGGRAFRRPTRAGRHPTGDRPRRHLRVRRRAARQHRRARRVRRAPGGLGPRRGRREVAAGRAGRGAATGSRRCPARSPTSASSATPRAVAWVRWPAPTGWPPIGSARSRSSPATASYAGPHPPSTPTSSSRCAAARARSASSPRSSSTSCASPCSTAGRCGSTASTPPTVIERWRAWSADAAGGRHHVVRAVPAAGDAGRAAAAGGPADAVGALRVDRGRRGGRRPFAEMRAAAPVLLDDVADKPYTAIDSVHTDPLDPMPAHRGRHGAQRLPGGGRGRAARADRPGVDVAAGAGRGPADGRRDRAAPATHESAFCSRDAAYSVLIVGIPGVPGVAGARRGRCSTRCGRGPAGIGCRTSRSTRRNCPSAYDEWTRARLRHAIRTYDPHGVIAIGRAFTA